MSISPSAQDLYRYVMQPTTHDLREHFDGLVNVAKAFDDDTLLASRSYADEFPDAAPVLVARFVFSGEIGWRLHGKPEVTYEDMSRTFGLS